MQGMQVSERKEAAQSQLTEREGAQATNGGAAIHRMLVAWRPLQQQQQMRANLEERTSDRGACWLRRSRSGSRNPGGGEPQDQLQRESDARSGDGSGRIAYEVFQFVRCQVK